MPYGAGSVSDPGSTPLRHSPLHARHEALGATFAEFGGWELARVALYLDGSRRVILRRKRRRGQVPLPGLSV